MNNKDFKWTEKRFGLTFANILKKLTGLSKDSTDGSIEYKDEQGNVTKLVTDSTFSSLLAKNGLTEVKWQELKDKRDNGQLIPGSLYRITDYQCTTTQENTRSAGHQFDIVLLALSENKLAEEGWAMMNESNVYDVTFSDGVTLKCYVYDQGDNFQFVNISTMLGVDSGFTLDAIIIDEINKTISFTDDWTLNSTELVEENLTYNYFQNSNLSAWKVWYCLDNDTARFAWADDSVDEDVAASITTTVPKTGEITLVRDENHDTIMSETQFYAWHDDEHQALWFTLSNIPQVGDNLYRYDGTDSNCDIESFTPAHEGTGPNGRGVIYRLIDEWNNDVAYDFKNIQFVRKIKNGRINTSQGTDTWVYTFNIYWADILQDATIIGNTLTDDEGLIRGVHDNKITNVSSTWVGKTSIFALSYNVILTIPESGSNYYYGIENNYLNLCFENNLIGDEAKASAINMYLCSDNTVNAGANTMYYSNQMVINTTEEVYIGDKKVTTENIP